MKRSAVAMALLTVAAFGQPTPKTVVIGTERLAQTPLDKSIYGALLEHIGQQMDTMWAELLQDHSFEGLRPFSGESERWAEGKVDEPSKRLVCTLVHGGGKPSSLESRTDFHTPDAVKQSDVAITGAKGIFPIEVAPYSVSKIVITLQ